MGIRTPNNKSKQVTQANDTKRLGMAIKLKFPQ
jgi:hypothetical protein